MGQRKDDKRRELLLQVVCASAEFLVHLIQLVELLIRGLVRHPTFLFGLAGDGLLGRTCGSNVVGGVLVLEHSVVDTTGGVVLDSWDQMAINMLAFASPGRVNG